MLVQLWAIGNMTGGVYKLDETPAIRVYMLTAKSKMAITCKCHLPCDSGAAADYCLLLFFRMAKASIKMTQKPCLVY